MATHTTVAAFRAALYAALVADSTMVASLVQIEYGEPAADRRDEVVWLGNSVTLHDNEQQSLHSGRRRRDETYDVELTVQVASKAAVDTNELRAAALVGAIEDIMALDTTLSVDGVIWAVVDTFSWSTDLSGDVGSPRTTVDMTIKVMGRLV